MMVLLLMDELDRRQFIRVAMGEVDDPLHSLDSEIGPGLLSEVLLIVVLITVGRLLKFSHVDGSKVGCLQQPQEVELEVLTSFSVVLHFDLHHERSPGSIWTPLLKPMELTSPERILGWLKDVGGRHRKDRLVLVQLSSDRMQDRPSILGLLGKSEMWLFLL